MRVRAVLLAAILVLGLTLDGSFAPASPHADFRAGIEYSDRGRDSRSCGSAASSGASPAKTLPMAETSHKPA